MVKSQVPHPGKAVGQPGVMTNNAQSNTSSVSTNWGWRKIKIAQLSPGGTSLPKGRHLASGRRPQMWWKRDQIVVTFRGGPSCSYEIKRGGRSWRYEGHLCLHDVMTHLAREV